MKHKITLLLCFFLLLSGQSFSQRYEAEDAAFINATSGGTNAVKRNASSASGGVYVAMNDGGLSFAVNVEKAGAYALKIVYYLAENYKAQNLVINGTTAGMVSFVRTASGSAIVFNDVTTVVSLKAGANTIAITRSWGWVGIDYIELSEHQSAPFTIDPFLVTPNPNESALKLYSFLRNNFQEKTISGVMTNALVGAGNTALPLFNQAEVAHIYNVSGKRPALVGFDFMHSTGSSSNGVWFRAYSNATISMATTLWEAGGIPVFCWH